MSENVVPVKNVVPVNCDSQMHVTSLDELSMYARGIVVRFPDFAEGQPFVARVKRPSLLALAKSGRIPNSLLTTAGSLFTNAGSGLDASDPKMLSDLHDICEVVCQATLIEPSYEQIKQAGLELSDDQVMAIFSYTQTGVEALKSFRQE